MFMDVSLRRFSSSEAVSSRRQQINCRDVSKKCRIVACASSERNVDSGGESRIPSSKSSEGSFLTRNQTYALIKQQMEVAAKQEVTVRI